MSTLASSSTISLLKPFLSRISLTTAFLLIFFLVPVGVLCAYSFGHSTPFSLSLGLSSANYLEAFTTPLFRDLLWRSIWVGALIGALCVVLAYPLAYSITLGPLRRYGDVLLLLVLVSLFSAYIVRVYAWRTLLGRNGVINSALESLGLTDEPLEFLLYSRFAVTVTLVNVLVPLAVLPLYSSLAGTDRQLLEAAKTLGASPLRAFWRITLPLSSKGVLAAFALCFIIAAGDYVTPQLVGGPSGQLLGNVIVRRFGLAFDWPLGSALAFVLIAAITLTIVGVIFVFRLLRLREKPA
jgi:spermidine/putrescine transport system permease protein